MDIKIKKEISQKLFLQGEENIKHLSSEREFSFYQAIANGDKALVEKKYQNYLDHKANTTSDRRNGILSEDPLQNRKYHFAILAAFVSRFCEEAGMSREVALSMTDVYILRADKTRDIDTLEELQHMMVLDFTERMKNYRTDKVYSKQISKCIDYIYDNLSQKLRISEIAEYLGMTSAYLSKLFSKEVGMSLSNYIRERRLYAAAQLLQFSDYTIAEISEYFDFSSQSHFTSTFQAKFGMTPKKYRDAHLEKELPMRAKKSEEK